MRNVWTGLTSLVIVLLIGMQPAASQQSIGVFDAHTDVGNPVKKGGVQYNADTQEYTMQGAGTNMWFNTDQFHFLHKKIKGDFIISATIRFIGKGAADHRKIGIIARDKLDTDSRYADACVHGDDLSSLQFRPTDGANTDQVVLSVFHPTDIELQRIGNTFTFSAAVFGQNYKSVTKELPLNEEVYAGLFICSHVDSVIEKAVFSNVRVVIPAAKDFRPYRDYIGSHIEVMDVQTGHRKVLHSAPNSLQAPNWTKDGKYLIYNSEGLMYRYSLTNGAIEKLNTGFANQNNNDHVLSFDGKQLAISHHRGEKRVSTLFTLPVTVFRRMAVNLYSPASVKGRSMISGPSILPPKKKHNSPIRLHWMIRRNTVPMANGSILILSAPAP
jgi:TolB protein